MRRMSPTSANSAASSPDEAALRADLAIANRILVRQGVVDAFGHVSARHPSRPTASCSRATWRPRR
jgi:HCOMODA/2-hydroxy-3-carboxy-muconic semialdehyde decarboxylase